MKPKLILIHFRKGGNTSFRENQVSSNCLFNNTYLEFKISDFIYPFKTVYNFY